MKNVINHALLLVGYDTDEKTKKKYWICKNEWGTDWGMNGYVHVQQNTNECGIAKECFYPII